MTCRCTPAAGVALLMQHGRANIGMERSGLPLGLAADWVEATSISAHCGAVSVRNYAVAGSISRQAIVVGTKSATPTRNPTARPHALATRQE